MSDIVYLNGSLLPVSQARVSVTDYGFLYGYGLFETLRAYNGQPFLLDRHLERLARSAEILGIYTAGLDVRNAVMGTVRANKLGDARVRITLSIGEGGVTPDPASCKTPTLLVVAVEYHPYAQEVYRIGFKAVTSSVRRNSLSRLSRLKTTNYLDSLLARHEARKAGADEAVCLNEKGLLAEAGMSNIFLVSSGKLRTPSVDSGILPGITRDVVLELTRKLKISAAETDIQPEEILQADEAFLTNSLMEVMPLTSIDGNPIGSCKPGQMTLRLMAEYKAVVASKTSGR